MTQRDVAESGNVTGTWDDVNEQVKADWKAATTPFERVYEAGRLAEKAGVSTVTEAHVDDALRQAEINRFEKLVSGQPPHVKHILRALASLTESNDQRDFRTADAYDADTRVAEQMGADTLSYDRVQRLLNERAFLGITHRPARGSRHGPEHTGGITAVARRKPTRLRVG